MKLKEAAQWWASRSTDKHAGGKDETEDALLALAKEGFSVPQVYVEEEEETFSVWPENWPTVQVFLLSSTQWNVGMGGLVGLRYEAVDVVMKRLKIKDPKGELFEGVIEMERAVLTYYAEKKANEGTKF